MIVQPEVQEALKNGTPVVALESNVISFGQAYPENVAIARAIEAAVREEGAVPATLAVLGGQLVAGLTGEQVEHLARSKAVLKCSRRDLPIVAGLGLDGATTVGATMIIAHRLGIRVFATGGIGGVHRGHPFDVSSDLEELGRTPLVVVCSGAKALLDMEATVERLETLGVPLLGYGTDQFPAFYSRESGLPVDRRVEGPDEVVAIARARDELGLSAAVLVGVPVPAEDELPRQEAEGAIQRAVQMADEAGIHGRYVTPFVLAKVVELTGGRGRAANVSLLVNNARVAARIARAWAAVERR